MNFLSFILIFVGCINIMGCYCVFLDINLDDLQSLVPDEKQSRSNKSSNFGATFLKNKQKEMELERAQRVSRNFERIIQLVNILGQVDSFLSDRTKLILRKLSLLAEDDDGYTKRTRS